MDITSEKINTENSKINTNFTNNTTNFTNLTNSISNTQIIYNPHLLSSPRFQNKSYTKNSDHSITYCKKEQRSDFKPSDWTKSNYYHTLNTKLDEYITNPPNYNITTTNTISTEDYSQLSKSDFILKYEKTQTPVLIHNSTNDWTAKESWNFKELYDRFKDSKVKVGEDDDGYKLKMKFKYFMEYMNKNKDDSPLYLFESSFENHKELKELLQDYKVPKYFTEDSDIFSVMNDSNCRPPYRWFLVGPKRSGTSIHIDPLGTAAWNCSLCGYKLWLVMPPYISKDIVKGKYIINEDEDDEAIDYFFNIFPRIKKEYSNTVNLEEIFFVQGPGDLIFIPTGWWHVVLNLTDTIAVTQNFFSIYAFKKIWTKVRKERKKMAVKFLDGLKTSKMFAEYHNEAMDMNKKDEFKMYDEVKLLNKKRSVNKSFKEHNSRFYNEEDSSSSSSSNSSSSSSGNSSNFSGSKSNSENENCNVNVDVKENMKDKNSKKCINKEKIDYIDNYVSSTNKETNFTTNINGNTH